MNGKLPRSFFAYVLVFVVFGCDISNPADPDQGNDDPEKPNSIYIGTMPDKCSYLIGEEFTTKGLVVMRSNPSGDDVELSDYSISDVNMFSSGVKPVEVSCQGEKANFDINVLDRLVSTGLPVAYITTEESRAIASKDEYINGALTIVVDGATTTSVGMRIKGRGNATWAYPKKPYKVKLDEKRDLLGMGSDKDWVLLANYCDKTLMRTSIGLRVGELLGMPWTPESAYVELVVNGEYYGNYQLVESVKKGNNRVHIEDNDFLIEKDAYYLTEPAHFESDGGYGYSLKYPDAEDISQEQINDIKAKVNTLENALASEYFDDAENGYRKYIDVGSFAKWFLAQQILANIDTNYYVIKSENGDALFSMGPIWDFEWSMGIGWYDGERPRPVDYFVCDTPSFYFNRLLQDPGFVDEIESIWDNEGNSIREAILAYYGELKTVLNESQRLNFRRWDILGTKVSVGGVPLGSFLSEVDCDMQFFENRMEWLDSIF